MCKSLTLIKEGNMQYLITNCSDSGSQSFAWQISNHQVTCLWVTSFTTTDIEGLWIGDLPELWSIGYSWQSDMRGQWALQTSVGKHLSEVRSISSCWHSVGIWWGQWVPQTYCVSFLSLSWGERRILTQIQTVFMGPSFLLPFFFSNENHVVRNCSAF